MTTAPGSIYNPWSQYLLPVLFAAPLSFTSFSASVSLDALKNAIYAYAGADIGFRRSGTANTSGTSPSADTPIKETMRKHSASYRGKALNMLRMAHLLEPRHGFGWEEDCAGEVGVGVNAREVALAAGLLLCFRDVSVRRRCVRVWEGQQLTHALDQYDKLVLTLHYASSHSV
jgi:hypothetical protein